jgi:Flp pilus assembly protein TadG
MEIQMAKRWQHLIQEFADSEQGVVAVLFGLLSFVLFAVSALAVDYSRATDMRTTIASAVDTASLAAGKAMLDGKLSDGEIATMATTYFDQNVKSVKAMGTVGAPEIKINRDAGTVDIDVKSSVKMTLARVSGFDKIDIPVSSSATYQQKDIEIGMALDITGSMGDTIHGTRKIDGLKKAFENFAEKLIPDNPTAGENVRIGIAPFSAAVNLGTYSDTVTDKRSKDHCVTERRNGDFSDATVVPGPVGSTTNPTAFQVSADGSKDIDPTDGNQGYVCPNAKVMPLTSDKTALVNAVKSFTPNGSTGGHFGVQWAYNLVSDKWGGVWGGSGAPASYSLTTGKNPKLVKAVILMTDGIFNMSYHNGMARSQALKLCTAIKNQADKNVVVFTIGFGLGGDPVAIQTLRDCATPSPTNEYFVNANDSGELDSALQRFAGKLSELRISR